MRKIFAVLSFALLSTSSAFAQLGSLSSDLVFTPITPCRVLDTRPSQGGSGPIAAAGTKHFKIWDAASGYAFQGGSPTNCGITAGSNVAAVAMNFTVVTPAAGGFITAYPFGASLPTAATVNFQVGDIARGDFTIAKVAQTGVLHLSIYSTSLADVVGDVVGYYSMPVSVGSFVCEDTTPVTSAIDATPFNSLYYGFATAAACSAGFTQVALRCYTNNAIASAHEYISGSCAANSPINTHTLYASRRCCRIPGR